MESGESPEFVAAGLGINRRTIYRWIEAFHYGGEAALRAKPIPGAPPKLDAKQMQKLARIVRARSPVQLNFELALWTLAMIRELVDREFAVRLSEVSVGRLTRRLGLSSQRPLYRAWQQDPALVERWRAEDYPKIAARAKRKRALIFFCRRIGHPLGSSCGHHLGAGGPDPGGEGHRGTLWAEPALGGQRPGTLSLHDRGRSGQCQRVLRVSQAIDH